MPDPRSRVLRDCPKHGEWVDDGTTDDCPECIAEDYLYEEARRVEQAWG